jgi:hypothetical protein
MAPGSGLHRDAVQWMECGVSFLNLSYHVGLGLTFTKDPVCMYP